LALPLAPAVPWLLAPWARSAPRAPPEGVARMLLGGRCCGCTVLLLPSRCIGGVDGADMAWLCGGACAAEGVVAGGAGARTQAALDAMLAVDAWGCG
jgi:hypothetical protein